MGHRPLRGGPKGLLPTAGARKKGAKRHEILVYLNLDTPGSKSGGRQKRKKAPSQYTLSSPIPGLSQIYLR